DVHLAASSNACCAWLSTDCTGTGFVAVFATVTSAENTACALLGTANVRTKATTTMPPIATAILPITFMDFYLLVFRVVTVAQASPTCGGTKYLEIETEPWRRH